MQPLTKRSQSSYAELAGPSRVSWFISHYWGTPFRQTVDAICHHAKQQGAVDWQSTTYWICTFANNSGRPRIDHLQHFTTPVFTTHEPGFLTFPHWTCDMCDMAVYYNVKPSVPSAHVQSLDPIAFSLRFWQLTLVKPHHDVIHQEKHQQQDKHSWSFMTLYVYDCMVWIFRRAGRL